MIEFLNPHDGPVVNGLEDYEIVYAKDQPEYKPLRVLQAKTERRETYCRWSLTDEQRQAIAGGADLFLCVLVFDRPLTPVSLFIATQGDIDPIETARLLNLTSREIPGVSA